MTRMAFLAATSLAALALAVQAGAMSHPKLQGDVGPGFTIHLKRNGATVKQLVPGTYTITVSDKSSIHNFHLRGPGVNVKTAVGFTGTKTFRITLKKGTYTFVCDPHSSSMRGKFKVS